VTFGERLRETVYRLRTAWRARRYAFRVPEDGIHLSCGEQASGTQSGRTATGGQVKLRALRERFPEEPRVFNLLYLVSSAVPNGAEALWKRARAKGVKLVWNQNGVYYPGWYTGDWQARNRRFAERMDEASLVVYQSAFARRSVERFVGLPRTRGFVLHNPVDTERFRPAPEAPRTGVLRLLSSGTIRNRARLDLALKVLREVRDRGCEASLTFAGGIHLVEEGRSGMELARDLCRRAGVGDAVRFRERFSREEAPGIYAGADILLHTQHRDVCPTVVLEAMASGLPVVCLGSGGMPELVGDGGGRAVPVEDDYESPAPEPVSEIANAVLTLAEDLPGARRRARERAVRCFDVRPWVERHEALFREVLEEKPLGCRQTENAP
jgi:glycosyltransferase involved in cell wall biosynthesis